MYEPIRLLSYKPSKEGTELKVLIDNPYIGEFLQKHKITKGEIRFDDERHITGEQRRKFYATVSDIAEELGYPNNAMEDIIKARYLLETGEEKISLRDCSVTQARNLINIALAYVLELGVEMNVSVLERTDDIAYVLAKCLYLKICPICGGKAEVHHLEAIGMGRDRKIYDDDEHEVIALCRIHHTEAHKIGVESFKSKYKVFGIKKKYLK